MKAEAPMERKHIPETENRLIILYTLRRLGPVTDMQLLQAMTEADLMNYITMQLDLNDLEQQGQITQRAHPAGNLIEMTAEGDYTLDNFGKRIPESRRHAVDARVQEWKRRFQVEQMAPAESFTLPDGRMVIHLRVLDSAATLLDLLLYLPAAQSIDRIGERWCRCVQMAYTTVLAHLSADYDAALPMPDIASTPGVRQCGENEWLLSLAGEGIDLMMSLPDEHLARRCSLQWIHAAADIRTAVLEMLFQAIEG